MTDSAGALLFARYAYPPCALGLCGTDEPGTLLEYGDAGASDAGLAELARTFDGAWPYLTLIAEANGIADPLDLRVVEAYWIGNDLLARVRPAELARHLQERFGRRIGRTADVLPGLVARGGVPHHCFHVFSVYPWAGLLRTGVVDEPLRVLDQCRITPARVLAVGEEWANVRLQPLLWQDDRLRIGDPTTRRVRWRERSRSFARPQAGDLVSLHWDFVCDVLSVDAAERLERITRQLLGLRHGRPVPRAVDGAVRLDQVAVPAEAVLGNAF